MFWLTELFHGNGVATAVLLLALVAACGLALGSIRVRGVGVGIAGTLFTGLAFGHFGYTVNPEMLVFARDFGLILFVYSIGSQVGPGFIDSLRRQGLPLNLMAATNVILGAVAAVGISFLAGVPIPAAVGLFSGATTNTPSLAAAQQALGNLPHLGPAAVNMTGQAFAVSYPIGIIGVIVVTHLVRVLFRVDLQEEVEAIHHQQEREERPRLARIHLQIKNANLEGVLLRDVPLVASGDVVVSRVLHGGELQIAHPETRLHQEDVLLAVGPQEKLEELRLLVGVEFPIDLTSLESNISTRRLIVTKKAVLGKTIDELGLPGRYSVTITRVSRAGIEFTPGPEVRLQFGDTLLAVGTPEALDLVAAEVGNSAKALSLPEVIPIFIGLALGVLLGSFPFTVPGVPAPVRLGLAGGPLLVAIVLSRIGRIGPLIWYLPLSANMILRELGIVLFLEAVGLQAGGSFVATLTHGAGLYWMALAAIITFVPLLVVSVLGRAVLKTNYLSLCGMLTGSMTIPPALAVAATATGSEAPSVAYATVYPLTMILRVLFAQLIVLLFMR